MIQHHSLTPAIRALLAYSPLQYMLDTASEHPALAELHTDREQSPTCCALRLGIPFGWPARCENTWTMCSGSCGRPVRMC